MASLSDVLAIARVYETWSRLVGTARAKTLLVREHVRPRPGARVLDLGCGPGEMVEYLGDAEYVGVDVSTRYIARARSAFGDRAEFRVGDATSIDADLRAFDLVLAIGVIHHLDDEGAVRLLRGALGALVRGADSCQSTRP